MSAAPLLSPEEVAQRCGLSRRAVYRAIERGELRASRLCSRIRIRPEDVDAWIAANSILKPNTAPEPRPKRPLLPQDGLRRLLAAEEEEG